MSKPNVVTPPSVDAVPEGTIKYSRLGTSDAQKAIHGMDSILKQFTKVAQEATAEEADAYRSAYVTVCKAAGTTSAQARASECNRVFHAIKTNKPLFDELVASGLGYHATISKLPTVKKSGAKKAVNNTEQGKSAPATSISEGKAKSPSADTALTAVFLNLKLVAKDAGTCKALLNAVLGLMEQSADEYLNGLADDLSTSWEAYEELHTEVQEVQQLAA